MKFLIIFLFSTLLFAQEYILKEIRIAKDEQGNVIEKVIEITAPNGEGYSKGLPQFEWNKTEDEQVQYVISEYEKSEAEELALVKVTLIIEQPKVSVEKKNKKNVKK